MYSGVSGNTSNCTTEQNKYVYPAAGLYTDNSGTWWIFRKVSQPTKCFLRLGDGELQAALGCKIVIADPGEHVSS